MCLLLLQLPWEIIFDISKKYLFRFHNVKQKKHEIKNGKAMTEFKSSYSARKATEGPLTSLLSSSGHAGNQPYPEIRIKQTYAKPPLAPSYRPLSRFSSLLITARFEFPQSSQAFYPVD